MERQPNFEPLIIELKNQLHRGVVTVLFVKESTGEPREMVCTLQSKYLPPEKPKADKKDSVKRTPNPDICNVYDIQREGWRSFHYDSIVEFRTIEGTFTPYHVNTVDVYFTPSGE